MKRWSRKILLAALILFVAVIAITQILMWTDYPRKLVLSLVQEELGLRVEARSLSTGWFGQTTLSDVKLSLPLADESFLDVPALRVKHTWLIPLLVTRSFNLNAIELTKPTLVVRRDARGRWNVQNVADLVSRTAGGSSGSSADSEPPSLPAMRVTDGTVIIIERDGRKETFSPLNVTGSPAGRLVYRYDAQVADATKLTGEVAPGDNWKHTVHVDINPRSDWLTLWVPDPKPFALTAQWEGAVTPGGALAGRAAIEQATYGDIRANGSLAVKTGGGPTVFSPSNLTVTTGVASLPKATLSTGTITVNGPNLQFDDVHVVALYGEAELNGTLNATDQTADLVAEWQDLTGPQKLVHGGRIELKASTPFPGRPEIAAKVESNGTMSRGSWDGRLHVSGAGRSWTDIDWTASVERFDWDGRTPLNVRDLVATAVQSDSMIRLTSLSCPAVERIDAAAEFNWRNRKWLVKLSGHEPVRESGVPMEFALRANGSAAEIRLDEFYVRTAGTQLRLSGDLIQNRPKPLALTVTLVRLPHAETSFPRLEARGRLAVEGSLSGTLDPVQLEILGHIQTHEFAMLQRLFGNIRGQVTGTVTDECTKFNIRDMRLLKGTWQVAGEWPYKDKQNPAPGDVLRINVTGGDFSLRELGELLRTPAMSGNGNTNVTLDIPFPDPQLSTLIATCRIDASNFAMNGFDAQQVVGQASMSNGVIKADPVTFHKTEGDVTGKVTVTYETSLQSQGKPAFTLTAQTWPLKLNQNSVAEVSADAQLAINTSPPGATGSIASHAIFTRAEQKIADVRIGGTVEGQVVTIDKIISNGVGGTAEGNSVIHLDDPNQSTMSLSWTGVRGQNLSILVPALAELRGTYSGSLDIAPTDADRALAPLRAKAELHCADGAYRTIAIGPAKLSAFVNLNSTFGIQRIVFDELPSEYLARQADLRAISATTTAATSPTTAATQLADRPLEWNELRLADGRVKVWARHGRHPSGEMQTHLIADFDKLNIEQLIHAFTSEDKPLPGRLSGKVILFGDPSRRDLLLGQGNLAIADSDLGNTVTLATLYDALRLGFAPSTPIGYGSLNLRMEQSTLMLQNLRYFNRGVEARAASISISNIWDLPNSPIDGYLVGTARPFKDLRIPFMADVDSILTVLQSSLTTVRIEGTVKDARARVVPFSEVGEALQRLLVGDVRAQTSQR